MGARATNVNMIRKILQKAGFSPLAIAGSLARMDAESNFNPRARNPRDGADGSDSVGILQWNAERGRALRKFTTALRAKNPNLSDLEAQTLFYVAEVKGQIGIEGKWGERLLAAKTPEDAAKAAISLARPKHWTPQNPERGLGYRETLSNIKRINSGDFTGLRVSKRRSLTGANIGDESLTGSAGDDLFSGVDDALAEITGQDSNTGLSESDFPPMSLRGAGPSGMASPPLDNSPEGKVEQILTGLGAALMKGQQKANKGKQDLNNNLFDSEKNQGVRPSPMADSIAGMIRGFV